MKKTLLSIVAVLVILGVGITWKLTRDSTTIVTNFEQCVAAGNVVLESYPRQCKAGEQTYTENIGNELEKTDFIRIDSPRPNANIKNPLLITGQARGSWFFEASFPVILTDWDGRIIAEGIATAKSNWMTSEFVPFETTLNFTVDKNFYSNRGSLILKKSNPSGLPEHDDSLLIPVTFADILEKTPVACSMEAKLCPDGSGVGRTGPNCEFAPCPASRPPAGQCLKDADCPTPAYTCEETQGTGTVCSSTDPSCVPTYTVIAGECKLKTGNQCRDDSECSAGNLCHKNICTAPIGRECEGVSDNSCPTDFQCVEGCGPPVVRDPDTTPVKYYCQLNDYNRSCPICLAKDTLIDTPIGAIRVQDLQIGMSVWTVNKLGQRLSVIIIETSKTVVPPDHKMVKLVLSDGRTLLVSPGHPTATDLTVGDLHLGDLYDSSRIISIDRVSYDDGYTYDILPSGDTGEYWANGILMGSTLR